MSDLTPVIYGATLLPEQLRWLPALNPMSLACEGFRCDRRKSPKPKS